MKRVSILILIVLFFAPSAFFAAADKPNAKPSAASGSTFHYTDPRMGEQKDLSDKFMFARIHTGPVKPGAYWGDGTHGTDSWSHDYPEAGLHLRKILTEVSKTQVYNDINEYVFTFDDPNLCKYPFAYLCEVGYMMLSDAEIKGWREYCLRGGFLLVDDFRGDWEYRNFFEQFKRAFPEDEYKLQLLDLSHPIFNCFFSIKTLDLRPIYRASGYNFKPTFYGLEDKHGRLMMIVNYNYDVSDYWQWSSDPFQPLPKDETNDAYKFGVNYIFYAMTH